VSQLTTAFPEMAHLSGMLARATQGLFFDRGTSEAVASSFESMRSAPPARRLVLLIEILTTLCHSHNATPLANAPREELNLLPIPAWFEFSIISTHILQSR